MEPRGDITQLLDLANDGDPEAMRSVLALLYDRLRVIAHRQLAREAQGHTLETDGLVHEAFLRLLGVERVQWRDNKTGSVETHNVSALFSMTGAVPNSSWLQGCVACDARGCSEDYFCRA